MEYPKLTPRFICEKVSSLSDIKLIKRPWDRFRPDISPWWLVPSTDILYYKYAKFYFNWGKNKQEVINCGLYVEKGLGESLTPVYSSKQARNLIMNKDWDWHKIVEAINELNKDQWLWLNLFICTELSSTINKSIADPVKEVYTNFLKPLETLIGNI